MSMRTLGAGLVLASLIAVGGCHNNQSRYCGTCAQPGVVAASPVRGAPTCNIPSPGALPPGAVVPGAVPQGAVQPPVPGFAP